MKNIFFIIVLCLAASALHAQEKLFVSKEAAKALKNNTRSEDGKPGTKYWQNGSDYKIQLRFTPTTRLVEGKEEISYYNNSPDTLKKLVIRLYPDLFKKGAARRYPVDPADVNEGVNIKSLKIAGTELVSSKEDGILTRSGTNLIVKLTKPMTPKSSLTFFIEWSFTMPAKTQIRMGTYDASSFFVGQWYPQMAVYDDISGWDMRDYNGLTEFYNDFSNYSVEISAPENFVVWATGTLSNADAVLNEPFLGKYKKAMSSETTVTVAQPADYKNSKITKQGAWTTWKYDAKNVSDFSFALSDHYVWEACSMPSGAGDAGKLFLQVAYSEAHADYKEVTDISRRSIRYLIDKRPGVAYPFPCMTVFDGADGMEYPMMTNVGSCENRGETVYAHSHEITHTYFPFYVGTNETKYGWMDESLAVLLPEKIQTEIEPTKDVPPYTTYVYSLYAGKEFEPALMTPTYYLTPDVYFILNYGKAEQVLRLLESEIGAEVFDKCLKEFMERWKYKHPTPYDFFYTFNNVSGKDMTWFWKAWYFEQGTPDLSIASATYNAGKCSVTIKNAGTLPVPVYLQFKTADGKTTIHQLSAECWTKGKNEIEITKEIAGKVTDVILGNNQIPDSKPSDNKFEIK
ncbi:MAG: M1 family metallopeptidase [Bacteroidota bacterium]